MKFKPVFYILENCLDTIKKVSDNIYSANDIPTKYAYIGWHGAKAWSNLKIVHNKVTDTENLINKYFKSIAEIILTSKRGLSSFNIVSLGVGTGIEDIILLKI